MPEPGDLDLRRELHDLHARLFAISCALGERNAAESLPASEFAMLVCLVAHERVSFMLDSVEEVVQLPMLTEIPEADEWIVGLLDLGGTLLPVIDVQARLERARRRPKLDDLVLICRTARGRFGLIVSQVVEVARVRPEQFQSVGSQVSAAAYVIAVLPAEHGATTLLSVSRLVGWSPAFTAIGQAPPSPDDAGGAVP